MERFENHDQQHATQLSLQWLKQTQFCELQNADPHLSADPPPPVPAPEPSAEPSPPNPAEELACNRKVLASESEEFAIEIARETP